MLSEPLLHVEKLTVQVKAKSAVNTLVKACSMTLHCAEKIAIVGQSGSGKSTFALALTRLLNPAFCWQLNGEVFFENIDLLKADEKQLNQLRWKKIAYLFQEAQSCLNPSIRLQKQLFEAFWQGSRPPTSNDEAWQRSVDVLKKMGLPCDQKALHCYPHQWSGGMCQRFCLAMAMAASPQLLIVDEPTTALDAVNRRQILSLLDLFVQECRAALILITHDLPAAKQLCSKTILMQEGRFLDFEIF